MKYLLVLLVVVLGIWLLTGRRGVRAAPPEAKKKRQPPVAAPEMVACAHCGMHVPASEALRDAADRPFCEEAHRIAGPAR
jgi:uncharacterized protein